MKIVYVTGCLGFIGSHVTRVCLKAGWYVRGIDKVTYASNGKLLKEFLKFKNFVYENKDINDIKWLYDCDYVINTAAETHVDNSIVKSDDFVHSNINGVHNLLELIRKKNNYKMPTLLHFSTDEVYGDIVDGSHKETDLLKPSNPYSATKTAAEHMIASYHNTYGTTFRTVRMSNNFGPRQHKEKLVPTILRKIKSGEKIPIYGDGKNIRDWFYVKDCANMVKSVLLNGSDNEVYNLTFSNEKQNLEIVDTILEKLGLKFSECVEFVTDRPGHDFRYSICNKKILIFQLSFSHNSFAFRK